ncbi:sortilin isoform X1 [Pangasianodon hypophthalmus]|uniref:sortilin isoform X1 n=1 Tax=Pangasianodon hypophthalmus TaxID=310915 RepID=UPI00230745BC|nr:sortilin isoform X1 [Pangasianodon hypophthalmus]
MFLPLDVTALCAVCLDERVMIWRLTALALACSLLLVDAGVLYGKRDRRTLTFSRSVSDEQDGNVRTKRAAWSLNSNFVECASPLSPKVHAVLESNTYETVFHGDDGSSFILAWVGDGTGVILILSTVTAPLDSFYERGSIRLYRSEDYGKSFHDISYTINSSFIRKDFGISVGPGNSQKVILTAELPIANVPGGVIFTSTDSGKTFRSVQLPFHPAQPISFHHHNADCLLVISTEGCLYLSQNFGSSWSKIHDGVYSFTWGSGITLFFSYSPKGTVEADRRGDLYLRRTQDLGRTFTTIAQNIFSFGYIGGFLFTSVMEKPGSPRVIYVSLDHGDHFTKALLPSASSEQFYSVLDGDEDMIFMHVDSPGDETYFGTVYTSDDRGILYSKSLERHLFGSQRKSDFTNVTSLRGVYLTNVFEEDGRICTVITFNNGGKWRPVKKPKNVECEGSVKRCNLHIHGEHSHYSGISPMLPLSDPSAVGLIIAHGSVGDSISASKPDVFVSSDGGYNWICALRGPHHYSILDSGGLIVAVEVRRDRQVNAIKFSTDEGQCWKTYNFTEHPIFFAGLTSEPGTKTLNISVFGYRPDDDDQPLWVAVTIDFEQLLTRECGEQDYMKWLAHSDEGEPGSETNGCVLGYKETFQRLRKTSVCRKGRNYVVSKQQKPCPCSREDYMCDYGYYRHENSSECVKQPEFTNETLELCFNGELEELQTTGYRKIPSDKCEGGFSPPRQMNAAKMHCGNSSQPAPTTHQPSRVKEVWLLTVISVSVGTVALAIVTAVTITVRRVNYRQRLTPYQFSALQLHEDELCVASESTPSSNQASYQEDSDDCCLTAH